MSFLEIYSPCGVLTVGRGLLSVYVLCLKSALPWSNLRLRKVAEVALRPCLYTRGPHQEILVHPSCWWPALRFQG